jgi:import receptor subunit TOM22
MVQLVEVEDEHFQETQPGPEEEDDFTDTGRRIWSTTPNDCIAMS